MERTRALEWKQDKKYLDYIDSEKCFLSERQEGEEKAIMKNLRLKKVSIKDLDQIRALYWRLLDSSPKYGQILQWKKNIYPNDDDWNSYIVKGEMYLILKDTDVIGAVAVTNAQSKEYRKIHWKVKADDQDAAVVHLLVKQGLAESREKAKAVIMAGEVFVQGQRIGKAVGRGGIRVRCL